MPLLLLLLALQSASGRKQQRALLRLVLRLLLGQQLQQRGAVLAVLGARGAMCGGLSSWMARYDRFQLLRARLSWHC
jgi:hypothetical protein